MANELRANDAPQEIIIDAAAGMEEEKEAVAIFAEKCLQIRRCIAMLGFPRVRLMLKLALFGRGMVQLVGSMY